MEATASVVQWSERYRPKTISKLVLPPRIKDPLLCARKGSFPNYLFVGPPGTGKTSAARALARDLSCEVLEVNAADDGTISAVKDFHRFAATVSTDGKRKLIIIDEADCLNRQTAQSALRASIEDLAAQCSFILVSNEPEGIIRPLRSRLATLDFTIRDHESAELRAAFSARVLAILQAEKVRYEAAAIERMTNAWFPDWRRLLNELQVYSVSGQLLTAPSRAERVFDLEAVAGALRRGDFESVHQWLQLHPGQSETLFKSLYACGPSLFLVDHVVDGVATLARYQSLLSTNPSKELCVFAGLLEVARHLR